jgi:hypothetical protein
MNKIIFPLEPRMKEPEVGDLQDALQLLLDRGVILRDDGAIGELSAVLQNAQFPLLKVAALHFDKLAITEPIDESCETSGEEQV